MISERKRHGNMEEVMYLKDLEEEKEDNDEVDDETKDEGAKKEKKKAIVQAHKTQGDYG
jgi:hypothetical protein